MGFKKCFFCVCIVGLVCGLFIYNPCLVSASEGVVEEKEKPVEQKIVELEVEAPQGEEAKKSKDLPKEIQIEKDGSIMVLIPEGPFWMGQSKGRAHHDGHVHKIYIKNIYVDKTEVTNAQYERFMEDTGYFQPNYWHDPRFNDPRFPVVGITWHDANMYAKWAGKRLPTEAEWEKSARGGLELLPFPWGETVSLENANYHSMSAKPVASYEANGYGLFDVAGNVWEWTADYYNKSYYPTSPYKNPQGPEFGRYRIMRGGAFNTSHYSLECGHRYSYDPTLSMYFIGFRCVKDVE